MSLGSRRSWGHLISWWSQISRWARGPRGPPPPNGPGGLPPPGGPCLDGYFPSFGGPLSLGSLSGGPSVLLLLGTSDLWLLFVSFQGQNFILQRTSISSRSLSWCHMHSIGYSALCFPRRLSDIDIPMIMMVMGYAMVIRGDFLLNL